MSDSYEKVLHINGPRTENHLAGAYSVRIPSFFSITGEMGRHINVTLSVCTYVHFNINRC
jgi:hypothetical protein